METGPAMKYLLLIVSFAFLPFGLWCFCLGQSSSATAPLSYVDLNPTATTPYWTAAITRSSVIAPTQKLIIRDGGPGRIEIDLATGNVKLTGLTPDQASREFWDKVGKAFGGFRVQVLEGVLEDYRK